MEEYGVSVRPILALMWSAYRRLRGTRGDPIKRVDAAAAGLAYSDQVTENNSQASDCITQRGQGPSVHGQTSPLRAIVSAPPST